jgi:hypothetical protein
MHAIQDEQLDKIIQRERVKLDAEIDKDNKLYGKTHEMLDRLLENPKCYLH